jgi:hypothetical protein
VKKKKKKERERGKKATINNNKAITVLKPTTHSPPCAPF